MIQNFAHADLEHCWKKGKCARTPSELRTRVLRKLDYMAAALTLDDLHALPGSDLHPLRGDRKGEWSLSVNEAWRITFTVDPDSGAFCDIRLEQYH